MKSKFRVSLSVIAAFAFAIIVQPASPGEVSQPTSTYQVLGPIQHGNLTLFPVVSSRSHDASQFLTLDEGLRSGEVVITEAGSASPLIRPRHGHPQPESQRQGAEVNRLVLVNNSKRPLLLLAGEIVTGGKQDRVIGKDRIVPGESDPIDVGVFCVEPGRWVGRSTKFDAPSSKMGYMVQPSVRSKAMAEKNQQQVWNEVGKARAAMSETVEVAGAAPEVAQTSSYAGVVENRAVRDKLDSVATPMEHEYKSVIGQLRDRNAVGVVVAVNGEIVWADVFASTRLLEQYWPKLVRSYAAESFAPGANPKGVDAKAAQLFLDDLQGKREVIESEPGIFRHTEVSGNGFKIFELASLLPGTGFNLHLAKMSD
jgi:hypothetical protein